MLAPLRRPAVRLSLFGAALAAAAVIAAVLGPSGRDDFVEWAGNGWIGPLLFVGLYVLLTVLLFPASAGTLAAGALYGAVVGTLLVLVAATAGATGAFLISRRFGHQAVSELSGDRLKAIDERLAASGLRNMIVIRLLPIVPFNVLNYAAGLTSVSTRDYIVGTAIGIVPGTIAFTAVGATAGDPSGAPFFLALAGLALLVVISSWLARRTKGCDVR